MKHAKTLLHCALVLGALATGSLLTAAPLGTAFTYQGRLDQNNQPAPNGIYQMTFWLWAASGGGNPLASNTVPSVPVTNGLFVADVDFGAAAFTGDERWLGMTVRTNNGALPFTLLTSRTRIAPTPNAVYAGTAGTATNVVNGAVVKSLNGLRDAVSLVAGPNITLTPSGNSLTVASTGGSGVWSLNGGSAYYNAGNVGIGTITPSTYGHGGTAKILEVNNSGTTLHSQAHLMLYSGVSSLADSAMGTVTWAQPGGMAAFIAAHTRSTTPGTPAARLIFGTRNAGDAAGLERMTIMENGNVGIGTSDPQAKLDVVGGDIRIDAQRSIISSGRLHIQANENLYLNPFPGAGDVVVGGGGGPGNLTVDGGDINMKGTRSIISNGRLHIQANENLYLNPFPGAGTVYIGGGGGPGNLTVEGGAIELGNSSGVNTPYLDFHLGVGADQDFNVRLINDADRRLTCSGNFSVCSLTIRGGCDLAGPFPMKEEQIDKGSVVVIDKEHPGQLKRSTHAYDKRVAGIVSGANGINPGIALKQEGALDQGENVALSGRVYVKADASNGEIEPGDLLTTSDLPGHAMKVGDHTKAQGAILGKAMSGLKEGTGLVLVLVTLQ